MHRGCRRTAASERRERRVAERAAGVQHNFSAPSRATEARELRGGVFDDVVGRGDEHDIRGEDVARQIARRDAGADGADGGTGSSCGRINHGADPPAAFAQEAAEGAADASGTDDGQSRSHRGDRIPWFALPAKTLVISFGTFILALVALAWIVVGFRMAQGALQLPRLRDVRPAADAGCPRISILFGARDEAEKLPQALATQVALDYPDYEIIAVDDRSADATPQILDEFAREHPRLKVIHVSELPAGWLGKPHALEKAYEQATGEWLVFTDADVRFAPDVLRRTIALAKARGWDHLTLLGLVDTVGFWEKVILSFFAMGFHIYTDPARVSDPKSKKFIGVGSFQLVRREAYEKSGTHRRLAMEVVDDLKLGKIIKLSGFRSGVGVAEDAIRVRWHDGLGNIIRGTTKNFFASAGYSVPLVGAQLALLLGLNLLPFAALPFTGGSNLLLAAFSAVVQVFLHAAVAYHLRVSPLYGLTHPLGALIFSWMLLRSTIVTLWRGGVEWRGTFYPLKELRKGVV
jgi:glycosyltransferase involved in cell wall biosynthesis